MIQMIPQTRKPSALLIVGKYWQLPNSPKSRKRTATALSLQTAQVRHGPVAVAKNGITDIWTLQCLESFINHVYALVQALVQIGRLRRNAVPPPSEVNDDGFVVFFRRCWEGSEDPMWQRKNAGWRYGMNGPSERDPKPKPPNPQPVNRSITMIEPFRMPSAQRVLGSPV